MDESLLGPWNTYQRKKGGGRGCVRFTRKNGGTGDERESEGKKFERNGEREKLCVRVSCLKSRLVQ